MTNIIDQSQQNTIRVPVFEGNSFLFVCLCPEDSAQLVSGTIFDRVCNRHNALPLESLIRLDLKCILHYDLQTNGDIVPVPLKLIQDKLDKTAKELDIIKGKIKWLISSWANSDCYISEQIDQVSKFLSKVIGEE